MAVHYLIVFVGGYAVAGYSAEDVPRRMVASLMPSLGLMACLLFWRWRGEPTATMDISPDWKTMAGGAILYGIGMLLWALMLY